MGPGPAFQAVADPMNKGDPSCKAGIENAFLKLIATACKSRQQTRRSGGDGHAEVGAKARAQNVASRRISPCIEACPMTWRRLPIFV